MKDVEFLKENGVNVEKSLELFGDIETYNETLETFLGEVEQKLSDISKYKEIADMTNYAILVHSLKSDAKYFGFDLLAELAYNHELESKANHIYYVYDKYDELMREAKRIVSIVKEYFGQEVIKENVVNPDLINAKTILVVDDSDVISSFIKKIFNNEFNVLVAKDGKQAIDFINQNDMIVGMLLDLNMPNINGFGVLEYLKQTQLFEKIPVSIITGLGNDDLVNKAFEYPIISILRKPFNERDLKDIVEKTIRK